MANHCNDPCTMHCLGCDADLGEEPLRDLCDLCHREWCADMEADARVKDAAHDLLAALKETLRASPMGPHVKRAQAAIAKAEGNGA